MNLQPIEDAWQKLAERTDLIGRPFVYDNRVGSTKDEGTISKIELKDGFVLIYSEEARTEASHEGDISPEPFIRFKIDEDEECEPHQVGDTIFCDLDDMRQIRISL